MVQENAGTVQTFSSINVQCDNSFTTSVTVNTNSSLIEGHIGSLASVKFLNSGKTLFIMPFITASADDNEIVGNIQLGQTVKVAVDYGRELASNFVLKIQDCSLVSTSQSLILVENSQVRQDHGLNYLNREIR